MARKDHNGERRPRTDSNSKRRIDRQPFTDSELLLLSRRGRPEDKRLSGALIAGTGAIIAVLVAYLAMGLS